MKFERLIWFALGKGIISVNDAAFMQGKVSGSSGTHPPNGMKLIITDTNVLFDVIKIGALTDF